MKKIMLIAICVLLVVGAIIALVLNHPSFGRSPRGERLARIERSPNYKNGEFHNQCNTPLMTSKRNRWQQMLSFLTEKKPENLTPKDGIEAVKTDLKKLDMSKDQVIWFGHSSYLLIVGGKSFLVDPVFDISFPASIMIKPFKGTDIYSSDDIPNVDYMIITHDHYDHLDYSTVKAIKERVGCVVCPLGVGEHLEYWGYDPRNIAELDWNEVSAKGDGVRITCLPARHFSGRFIKRNPTLWASFMIESGRTVYVGGDGGYGAHFKEIGKQFANIELALLENGQYNKDWRYIHTLPEQLPQVIHDLNAKQVLPVHNSRFALSRHSWNEPIDKINEAARKDSTLHILAAKIGQPIIF